LPSLCPALAHRAPAFDIRTPLHVLTGGADLSQIHSIGPQAALQLVAEIGTDMSRWPTEHHFASWTTLAPNNKISGGRLLSSRTPPSANRAAAILRRCAMSLGRTSTALGAFYRRLAARVGKAKAITATARKLAVLVYRVLSGDLIYSDPVQPLTTSSTALVNSSRCANAPSSSASSWSIALPVRCY
jgi:transposase